MSNGWLIVLGALVGAGITAGLLLAWALMVAAKRADELAELHWQQLNRVDPAERLGHVTLIRQDQDNQQEESK